MQDVCRVPLKPLRQFRASLHTKRLHTVYYRGKSIEERVSQFIKAVITFQALRRLNCKLASLEEACHCCVQVRCKVVFGCQTEITHGHYCIYLGINAKIWLLQYSVYRLHERVEVRAHLSAEVISQVTD